MKVQVVLANGIDKYDDVTGVDNTQPGAFRVTQRVKEEQSPTGLIARVGGRVRFTLYPWHRVLRVEIEE